MLAEPDRLVATQAARILIRTNRIAVSAATLVMARSNVVVVLAQISAAISTTAGAVVMPAQLRSPIVVRGALVSAGLAFRTVLRGEAQAVVQVRGPASTCKQMSDIAAVAITAVLAITSV